MASSAGSIYAALITTPDESEKEKHDLFIRVLPKKQVLQHTWTYKPLVHDVLGMDLNRITVEEPGSKPVLPGAATAKKSFEVGDGDFFWESHGRAQFPKVAAEVDAQIMQYKQVDFRPR